MLPRALLAVLTLVLSCHRSVVLRADCLNPMSDGYFFSPGSVGYPAGSDLDGFVRGWYSRSLRLLAEPSLSCGEPAGETYRFMTTNDSTEAVRITHDGVGGGTLFGAETGDPMDTVDGTGSPGKVKRRTQFRITPQQWEQVEEIVKGSNFWKLPTSGGDRGADGEDWVIEGRRRSDYHVVKRWSPRDGAITRWLLLMKWAGFSE